MPAESLFQVTAPGARGFCAGVVVVDGCVCFAAPILRRMLGWDGRRFAAYCRQRGWSWVRVA